MADYIYQITADSGCDLSLEKCTERGVIPYKMPFTMDGKPMIDGMTEESFREFYDLMRAGGIARTSQINPGEFTEFWRPLAEAGKNVLHISLAAAISGSCDNARSAAAMLMEEYPGWTCRVVDSANASAGFGLVVLRAADNRDKGMELEANARELESIIHNVNSIFTTNDLTYLYRGGRVSKTAAAFGTALNIVPIMHLDYEGHLEVWQKVRGDKQCFKKVLKDIKELVENAGEQTLIVSEADAPEKAREYGAALVAECGFRDVFYTHIGPIIGAHTGPGLISVFFVGKERS
ncbi:MAG: DegV family protein [Oscillospiraceae bacterium]|nr:DegV family protein [Bacillota bacterium]